MLLTEYTSPDEVRAVLGADSREIPDSLLALDLYVSSLRIELRSIADALPADFDTVKGIDEGTRTALQQTFWEGVKAFAPYAVAVQLASTLPLGIPKTITDGKASVTRDASSAYKATIELARSNFERFRTLLISSYAAYKLTTAAATERPWLRTAQPIEDPVTREG